MEDFLKELADILDEETVSANDRLDGFEAWDSLAILSVIAMAESRFRAEFSSREIRSAGTAGDLYRQLSASAKKG